jgi:hypothetical protein
MHNQINTECLLHILPEIKYFILYIIYYLFSIFIFQEQGLIVGLTLGTILLGKDKKIIVRVVAPPRRRISPSTNWSERSAFTPTRHSLCRRLVCWTARCSPTSHSSYSSLRLHRQLCWVLASWAGDFSTFGFFMQLSSAELGTPWRSSSLCKSRQLS